MVLGIYWPFPLNPAHCHIQFEEKALPFRILLKLLSSRFRKVPSWCWHVFFLFFFNSATAHFSKVYPDMVLNLSSPFVQAKSNNIIWSPPVPVH